MQNTGIRRSMDDCNAGHASDRIILSVPMLVSLVAMDYHFVSDVIAGSVLGALIAAYAVQLARLKMA